MAKILLVLDEPLENPLLCELLDALGHQCLAVCSGEGALRALETAEVEMVILDFMTPDMDGFEVLRRIRTQFGPHGPPVVLFSEIAEPRFRRCAIRRGAVDYWIKGVMDLKRLNEMVTAHAASNAAIGRDSGARGSESPHS